MSGLGSVMIYRNCGRRGNKRILFDKLGNVLINYFLAIHGYKSIDS